MPAFTSIMPWPGRFLSRLFSSAPSARGVLSADQQARLEAWRALPEPNLELPHFHTRYIVADVEASGLHMTRDRLISIGAVGMSENLLANDDAFEVILRQEQVSDTANILLHGIGGSAQRDGIDPAEALLSFLEYSGKAPLVAFHAVFDQTMIEKAMREYLGLKWERLWIDLAWVLPVLYRDRQEVQTTLDYWLDLHGIENIVRHNAVSDSYATAKLLQVTLARAAARGAETPRALMEMEKTRRWMMRTR